MVVIKVKQETVETEVSNKMHFVALMSLDNYRIFSTEAICIVVLLPIFGAKML